MTSLSFDPQSTTRGAATPDTAIAGSDPVAAGSLLDRLLASLSSLERLLGAAGPLDQYRLAAPGGSMTAQRGDTLSGIAQAQSVSLGDLLRANPNIYNPDRILIGQQINLPQSGRGTSGATSVAPAARSSPPAIAGDASLGSLSAKYESGSRAFGAIGYDKTGGWSYGKYQFASRTGTMDAFLARLKTSDPASYARLQAAGGATAARAGSEAFKAEWRALANQPSFQSAQHMFTKASYYDVMAARMDKLGVNLDHRSAALRDVIWSMAVQHGPNAKRDGSDVLSQVARRIDLAHASDADIIRAIYAERGRANGGVFVHFSGSTTSVQASVSQRFHSEQAAALRRLGDR